MSQKDTNGEMVGSFLLGVGYDRTRVEVVAVVGGLEQASGKCMVVWVLAGGFCPGNNTSLFKLPFCSSLMTSIVSCMYLCTM